MLNKQQLWRHPDKCPNFVFNNSQIVFTLEDHTLQHLQQYFSIVRTSFLMPRVFTSFFFFFFFSIQSFCLIKRNCRKGKESHRGTEPFGNTLVGSFLLLPQLITNNLGTSKTREMCYYIVLQLEVWHGYDWARSRLSAVLVPSQGSKEEFVSSFWMLLLQSIKGSPL